MLPWWLRGKESACNVGGPGSIPGLGRSLEEGNGNLLQYSYLENPISYSPWGCKDSDRTEGLITTKQTFIASFCAPSSNPGAWGHFTEVEFKAVLDQSPSVSDSLAPCGLQPARLPRQEDWSWLPLPPPGLLPDPGIKPSSHSEGREREKGRDWTIFLYVFHLLSYSYFLISYSGNQE